MRCAKEERYEQCTALIEAPCAKKSPRTRAVGGYLKHKTIDLGDERSRVTKNGDKSDECACREGRAEVRRFVKTQLRPIPDSFQTAARSSEGPRATDLPRVYRDAPRYLSRQLERHVTACCGSMVHARTRGVGMGYTCPI